MKNSPSPKTAQRKTARCILSGSIAAACAVALLGSTAARAATYYWDVNSTTAGFGAAGSIWGTDAFWTTDFSGAFGVAGITSPGTADDVNFGTATLGLTSGTITVNGAQSAQSITFGLASGAIVLSGGTSITLGGTGLITVNNTAATIGNNTALVLAGSVGLTKAGTGTLTLNGTTANTFTGGLRVNAGTLALDFSNLGGSTPFSNLVASSNALTLGGGNLSIIGNNTSSSTTTQTVASTTVASGGSTVTIAKGASATSATLNLGAVTRGAGGTVTFLPTTAWAVGGVASATEIVTVASVSNINGAVTMPTSGNVAFIGAGFFSGTGINARIIQVKNTGTTLQLVGPPATSTFVLTGGSASLAYSINANQTLTGATTNYALLPTATTAFGLVTSGTFTYTTNGILNVNTALFTLSSSSGTGVIIGAERDLVLNNSNSGGTTISSPIANNAGGLSNVTISNSGTGVTTLSGANTYTGLTTINSGTLKIGNITALGAQTGTTDGTIINFGATLDLGGTGIPNAQASAERITASGSGVGGNGAIISSSAIANPFIGVRFLTLAGDTTLGSSSRWDVGDNTGKTSALVSNGFTLTFLGSGASASMALNGLAGNDLADIIVNLGSVNTLFLQQGTTLGIAGKTVTITGGSTLDIATASTVTSFDKNFALNNGILKISESGTVSLLGTISLTTTTNTINTTNTAVASGVISGTGSLTKSGLGSLTLSGTGSNTFTGLTTVAGGGLLTLAKTSGAIAIAGDLTLNGTTAFTATQIGTVATAGNFGQQFGAGTVVTFITSGTNRAYLKLYGNNQTIAGLSEPTAAGGVFENFETETNFNTSSILTINNSADYSFSGFFRDKAGAGTGTGTLALIKSGGGMQTLAGANITYTGPTTLNVGTLGLTGTTANASAVTFGTGTATLQINSASSIGGLATTSGAANANAIVQAGTASAVLTVNQAGTSTFGGILQNNAITPANTLGLTKIGAGTLTLTGTNTYTGNTTISGGTLVAANTAAFGPATAQVSVNTGSFLELATDSPLNTYLISVGSNTAAPTIRLSRATSGPAFTQTLGGLNLGANDILNVVAGSNIASGTPTLSFTSFNLTAATTGSSTLNPTTANLTIGTVSITANNFVKSAIFDGSSTGNFVTGNITDGVTTLPVTKSNTSTWTFSGNNSYTGATTVSGGALILSGTNTGAGATSVVGGTLQAGAVNAFNPNSDLTTTNAATAVVDLNGNNNTVGSLAGGGNLGGNVTLGSGTLTAGGTNASTTFSGAITGGGGLIKNGTGAMTLANAAAYTGATLINGGSLIVNSTFASSGTTVANTGTLGGVGTFANLVTVNSGGTLSPATATTPGTITLSTLTLDAGSALAYEFGGSSDLVAVTSSNGLTLNGGALNLYATGGVTPLSADGTYSLFTYSTGYTGSVNNLTVSNSQFGKVYSVTDDTVNSIIKLTVASATTTDWSGGANDGLWTTAGNWTAGTPNGLGAVANFGTIPVAPTSVAVDGGKTVGAISFNNANAYTITGTGADPITIDNGIANASISVTAGSHTISAPIVLASALNVVPAVTTTLNLAGAISGAKGVNFTGAGTTVVSGVNTYSGPTNVSAGTVQIGVGGTTGNLSATGSISGGTLIFNRSDALTQGTDFTSLIFGTAALTQSGTGTTTLSSANTYNGATVISAGTLNLTGSLTGTAITVSGTGVLSESSTGVIGGAASVTHSSSGTSTLAGANTYNGATTLNAGVLRATTNASALGAGALTLAGGELQLANDTALNFGRNTTVTGNAQITSDTLTAVAGVTQTLGTLSIGAFTLNVGPGANATGSTAGITFGSTTISGTSSAAVFSPTLNSTLTLGTITGTTPTITMNGTGTLVLAGTLNTVSLLTINSGSVSITTNNAVTGALTVNSPGILNMVGGVGEIFGALNGNGTINTTGNFLYTNSASNGSYSGTINGSGGYIKGLAGIQTLSGLSTYTGQTLIGGGTLIVNSLNYVTSGVYANHLVGSALGSPGSAAAGTIAIGSVATGAQLTYNGPGEVTDRVIDLAGTTGGAILDQSGGSGTLEFTSPFTATGAGLKSLTLQGSTGGSGKISAAIVNSSSATSLIKAGTGTWTLSGANTYTGATTVNAGTLLLDYATNNTGVVASTSALIGGGGTLSLLGNSGGAILSAQTLASLSLTAGTASNIVLNPNGGTSTILTITSPTVTTGAGATMNFNYAAGTTNGSTLGNAYVAWNASSSISGSYTVTDTGGTGFATVIGGNVVRIADTGSAGLPVSGGVSTTNYFVNSTYSTNSTSTPGSLVEALSGNVAANTVTVDTTGLASGANLALGANTLTLTGGGGMYFSGTNPYTITNGTGGGITSTSGGTLFFNNSGSGGVAINAPILANGTNAVTFSGTGTTTLGGTNTYTGTTTITAGTLRAGSSTAFNGTSLLAMTGTSTLDLNGFNAAFLGGSTAVSTATITDNSAGAGTSTLTLATDGVAFAGLIANGPSKSVAVAVSNNSSSFLLTNASNTFSGGLMLLNNATGTRVNINSAITTVGSPGAITSSNFGTGAITIGQLATDKAGIFFQTTANTVGNAIVFNTALGTDRFGIRSDIAGITLSGTITANLAAATFSSNAAAAAGISLTGQVTGANGLILDVSQSGGAATALTVTLNNTTANANNYAGDTVINRTGKASRSATLTLGADNQISNGVNTGNVSINSTLGTGILNLAGYSETINGLSGNGTVDNLTAANANNTFTVGDNNQTSTFTGVIKNTAGILALTKTGTGTLTLSGTNTYTGLTTVSGGTLNVTGSSTGVGLTIANGTTFNYKPIVAGTLSLGNGALTFNGTSSTIGTAVGGTASQSVIATTGAATVNGAVTVNIYGITGVAPTAGSNNLITAASGGLGSGFTMGNVYNASNFTVSGFTQTANAVSVTVATQTALTNEYWVGGFSGNQWAATDGSTTSNWVATTANGSVTSLTPGSGTTVNFSATSPNTPTGQGSMTLGANMSILGLVDGDSTPLTLNSDGFALTLGTGGITVNSDAGAVAISAPVTLGANQTWTNNSVNNLSVSGVVSGAFALTKAGTGTLVLSGNNTYTGATTVSGGILVAAGGSAAAGLIVVGNSTSNAVLNVTGTMTGGASINTGSTAGSFGAVNINGGTLTMAAVSDSDTTSFGGAEGSYGALTISSGGTFTQQRFMFGGTSATTTLGGVGVGLITNGTVNTNSWFILARHGASTGVVTITGGTINHTGGNANPIAIGLQGTGRAELNVAGGLIDNTGKNVTLGGSGSGFIFNGTGVVNLNAGTLITSTILYNASSTAGSSYVNFSGGTLKASSASTAFLPSYSNATGVNKVFVNGAFGTFAGGAVIDTNGFDNTISANLLAPTGNGVTSLSITSAGSGYIGAPALKILEGGIATTATAYAVVGTDSNDLATFGKITSVVITNPGNIGAGALTVNLVGGGGTGAAISVASTGANTSGGLTKQGLGTLILSGTNTYAGGTTVSTGKLQVTNASAPGSGGVGIAPGAQVWVNAANLTIANNFTLSGITTGGAIYGGNVAAGSVINLTGTITLNATSNMSTWWNDKTLRLSGQITGTGGLNFDLQTGAVGGRYYITGATNNYLGATTVTGGAVQGGYTGQSMLYLGATNALPTTTALTLNSADLYLNGQSQQLASITGTGTYTVQNGSTTAATLTLGTSDTTSTFAGAIKDNGLSVTYTTANTSGTPTLTTGTVALTKTGLGTLTLSGANTYTGATIIKAGTLALGASGSFANSTTLVVGDDGSVGTVLDLTAKSGFNIVSGQTLKGIGTVNIGAGKTLTVDPGATWAPGNSIATNTVIGNLTLAGASNFELGTTGASHAAPGTSDRTDVSGALTLGGTLNLVDNAGANSNGSFAPGSYKIFTYGSALSGSFGAITNIGTNHAVVVDGGSGTGSGLGVFLEVIRLAIASVFTSAPIPVTSGTIAFGNVRVGATTTQALTISNDASTDGFSEKLNASLGGATGAATTSGAFTLLAAGSSDTTSLIMGINTTTAGVKSGTGTIALSSDGTGTSGYGTTALASQMVNVSGSAYDLANANYTGATLVFGNVRTGASATAQTVAFGNQTVTSASFQDLLDVSVATGNARVTASGFTGLAASTGGATTSNLSFGVNTASAGSLASTASLTLTSNANGVIGLSNGTATVVGSPGSITTTGGVYDFAKANYTGGTLAFGNVHVGASVSAQTVAFGNQTVTSASFQDLLDVSATTGNSLVTATGFTGLAASTGGLTTSNLSFGVNTATVGSLASTANLTLTSNANGVSGLSNGTATVVGSPTAITTTGNVYSGLGVWDTNGNGNWSDFSKWTTGGGAPGLDAGFQTGQDAATFASAATSSNPVVDLVSVSAVVSAVTFNNATQSYTVASSGGGTLNFNNTANSADATLTNTAGIHTISAPVQLQSNLAANLTSGTLTVSGVISESGLAKSLNVSGGGTLVLSGANTYSGATTIGSGILQIGSGSTTGSLTATSAITNNGNLTINRSDAFTQASDLGAGVAITGTGSFTQAGAGTTTLTAANTYTGATTVSAGTLEISGVSGSLSGTTNVSVTAGTLLLSGDASAAGAAGRIRDTAVLTLGTGGNLAYASTLSNATETMASLTLSGNSTLDFGAGSGNQFLFTGNITGLSTSTLTIYNWSGPAGDSAQDVLAYGSTLNTTELANISFYAGGSGSTFLGTANQISFGGSNFQVVPVPEPTTIFGALALVGLVGYRERRRFLAKRVA